MHMHASKHVCVHARRHARTHTQLQAELITHVCYKKQNSTMPFDFKTGMKSEEFW
jgi:hypothetical protein